MIRDLLSGAAPGAALAVTSIGLALLQLRLLIGTDRTRGRAVLLVTAIAMVATLVTAQLLVMRIFLL